MADITNLYSEKVLDHFNHPRNVGEIENPDGVGTVGNPVCGDVMRLFIKVKEKDGEEYIEDAKFQTLGCLPYEEEVVLTKGEWFPIGEITVGKKVLNGEAKETISSSLFVNNYQGRVLTIVPFVSPFNSFTVTPNHPILSIKRNSLTKVRRSSSKCAWLRIDENELLSKKPTFVRADELKESDYLIFPKEDGVTDNKFFTRKVMRLLGYYLSEGYITAAGTVVNFSFNCEERNLIDETKSLIFDITGKSASERTRKNVTEIRLCSKKWADFFLLHCSKLARNKAISETVLKLPFKKQWEMMKTYILGNGDVYRRRSKDTETFRMITASKLLAIQIQRILSRGGLFASIREIVKTNCVIEGRKLKDSIQYLISFKLEKTKNKLVRENKDCYLVPIRKIKKKNFKGKVYNFQVLGEPNSYLIKGFAVHNCGAAIATSSIATEMIKGKPLKDAVKLTNQAITEALGGLPKAKIHCSVLAADAVKKAVEDYRSKK
jgi:nitrogen fixation NifU-like protein